VPAQYCAIEGAIFNEIINNIIQVRKKNMDLKKICADWLLLNLTSVCSIVKVARGQARRRLRGVCGVGGIGVDTIYCSPCYYGTIYSGSHLVKTGLAKNNLQIRAGKGFSVLSVTFRGGLGCNMTRDLNEVGADG